MKILASLVVLAAAIKLRTNFIAGDFYDDSDSFIAKDIGPKSLDSSN